MKAVIPVAGVGTRLRPHTHTIPKALLYVAGKPILGHILDMLSGLEIDEIVLVIGYMGEKIRDYVSRTYDLPIRTVEQTEARGLGHAIWTAREAVAGGGPLLVVLGDTIFDLDLGPILRGGETLIGVREVEDPRRFGVVETDGSRILRVVEKPERPPSNLAIVGLYYFTDGDQLFGALDEVVSRNIRTRGEFQLTDALQRLLDAGVRMSCLPVEGWFDCGSPETLLATNRYLLDRDAAPVVIEGSVIVPPVSVDREARVERCVLGPYVSVAAGVEVRNAVVRNSILCENAVVENIVLEGSLIGDNAIVRESSRRLNVGDSSEIQWG